jgi:hypothetical protein
LKSLLKARIFTIYHDDYRWCNCIFYSS